MQITCSKLGRNLIINLQGEIDHHSSQDIRNTVDREFRRNRSQNIVFDFKSVSFMDSSGIGMIIGRYKNIGKINGKVAIAGAGPDISRIFEISGLQKIIKCYDTVQSAVKELE